MSTETVEATDDRTAAEREYIAAIQAANQAVHATAQALDGAKRVAKEAKSTWEAAVGRLTDLIDAGPERYPLFEQGQGGEVFDLEALPIESLQDYGQVSDRQITLLQDAGFDTVGKLIAQMKSQADWWHREITGIGPETKVPIEEAVAKLQAAAGVEEEDELEEDEPEEDDGDGDDTE